MNKKPLKVKLLKWLPAEQSSACSALGPEDVHVWQVVVTDFHDLPGCLSEEEQERAQAFYFQKDKIRFRVAHTALRQILSCYTGLPPLELTILIGQHGKPSINFPLCFNLSHSQQQILIAVTALGEVGVDVEYKRCIDSLWGIVEHQFSTAEQATIKQLSPERQRDYFFDVWTYKEAYLKAIGTGLQEGLNQIVLVEGDRLQNLATGQQCRYWQFCPDTDYAAAVAVVD